MDTYTIIVTGPRDYKNYSEVARLLAIEFSNACDAGAKRIVVKHGAAKGADSLAMEFVNKAEHRIPGVDIKHQSFYANWDKYKNSAGPIRNKEMVDSGADVCLVFLDYCTKESCTRRDQHYSHGTTGCAKLAKEAGVRIEYSRKP